MRTLIFQHTPEEVPGSLAEWLVLRKLPFHVHHWYREPDAPTAGNFDCLVVLGGPMNVDDEADYPWLRTEKSFLRDWIASGRAVLGICLGGQLLAEALGARVGRSECREVGFWKVQRTEAEHPALQSWPAETAVYQFHGDRFELPAGCISLLSSPGCAHQAFARGRSILGLQFHPESTPAWIKGNAGSVKRQEGEPYVQAPEETEREIPRLLPDLKKNFFHLLDGFRAGLSAEL
jgi:GMP synthase-like glutamine amidotransferase